MKLCMKYIYRKFLALGVKHYMAKLIILEVDVIIIAGNSHPVLAGAIARKLSLSLSVANTKKFEDQELRIQIEGDFNGQDVVIVQSTSKPANDHFMELLLLADTVKRAGASRIIAIVPYFGYGRQDRPSYKHGPISASLIARLIESSGIDRVITLDLHSKQSEGFFRIGVQNLDTSSLFLDLFKELDDYIIVSPDLGGLVRAQKLANLASADLAVINKVRTLSGECIMNDVLGNVKDKNCILVDDIIDTGRTLCTAANLLIEKGAKSVSACVTHAVLSGECNKRISAVPFNKFYVTDSIMHESVLDKIQVVSVVGILSNAIYFL